MNMQSILRWSLENSDPQGAPSGSEGGQPPRPIDPEILDAILGKPDSELMKEALAVATDELKDEDAKLTALDDFEMVCSHYLVLLVLANITVATANRANR